MTTGRNWAASSQGDELLSRLYQQVTERQAAQFAARYDMAAGLDRYRAWLDEHAAEEPSRPKAVQLQGSTTRRARAAGSGAGTATEVIDDVVVASGAGGDADQAIIALYNAHYRSLVHLAALLVHDVVTAEVVVQDSFVALYFAWPRLRNNEKALSYLHRSVVNRSRSTLRHREMVDRTAPGRAPDRPAAEQDALTSLERSAVVTALRALPARQREALLLRYYADLSPTQIASAMGISHDAVKSHTARAMAALRSALEKTK
jgi:RNA polymerase sigma-70 factor (sigma-E family)